jgi:hypothetical protein
MKADKALERIGHDTGGYREQGPDHATQIADVVSASRPGLPETALLSSPH